jgi:hypothetical protein
MDPIWAGFLTVQRLRENEEKHSTKAICDRQALQL